MDRNYLYQVDIREWIENGLDAEIMVPVFGNRVDKKYDVYLQSFLLPIDAVESDMQNDTYNANTMEPGITVYGSWENDEKVRFLPLVLVLTIRLRTSSSCTRKKMSFGIIASWLPST